MSTTETLEERGNSYGEFDKLAELTQQLEFTVIKHFMDTHPPGSTLPPYMRESLHMILQKIARAVNGNPYYDDSWQDIAGYAQLVVNKLNELNKPPRANVPTQLGEPNHV